MGTQISFLSEAEQTYNNAKFNSPATYGTTTSEDRVITGKGYYDLSHTRNEYEFEEDLEEVVQAKSDKS